VHVAGPNDRSSRSKTHGGFDNDRHTMNSVLAAVLEKRPPKPFQQRELDY